MEEMKELEAMRVIAKSLSDLNKETQKRVIQWTIDKFDLVSEIKTINDNMRKGGKYGEDDEINFEQVADLYNAAAPSTDAEKALIIGYWFQYIRSESDFDSQSVNSELKHLGHAIGNITRAFNQLKRKSPQLAIQTKKMGSTKQARKKYKLTNAGKKYVEELIAGNN